MTVWAEVMAWTASRATVLAVVGVLLYGRARRGGAEPAASTAFAALISLLGIAALAFAPWPRWWTLERRPAAPPARAIAPARSTAALPRGLDLTGDRFASSPQALPDASPAGPDVQATPGEATGRELARGASASRPPGPTTRAALPLPPKQPTTSAPEETSRRPSSSEPSVVWGRPGWPWRSFVAWAYLAGLGVGLMRIAMGLWAVRRLRVESRPIEEAELLSMLRRLADEMGVRRKVEARASADLTTPATVGWLRPLLLLPADWAEWDADERRAVLAHELAHIRRCDYPAGLLARLSLALHFYHPLAHWLAGRLRLEQELAADATAARHAGGRPTYLATLARMALRQDSERAAWAARPFYPRFGTLLRRIEMLRNGTSSGDRGAQWPLLSRGFTYALFFALGLVLAGLRAHEGRAGGPKDAQAGAIPAEKAAAETPATTGLEFVPSDAAVIVSVKPSALAKRPELGRIFELLGLRQHLGDLNPAFGKVVSLLDPAEIEQVTFVATRPAVGTMLVPGNGTELALLFSGVIVRTGKARVWMAAIKDAIPGMAEARHGGQVYQTAPINQAASLGFFEPDDHTVVVAAVPMLFNFMKASRSGHRWEQAWRSVGTREVVAAGDAGLLLGSVLPAVLIRDQAASLIGGAVAPLWEDAETVVAGLDSSDGVAIEVVASCADEASAQRVERTLQAVLTLAGNAGERFFPMIRPSLASESSNDREKALLLALVDLGGQLLDGVEVRRSETTVRFGMAGKTDLATWLGLIFPKS